MPNVFQDQQIWVVKEWQGNKQESTKKHLKS